MFSVSKYLKIISYIYYILRLQLFLSLLFKCVHDRECTKAGEWAVGEQIALNDKTGLLLSELREHEISEVSSLPGA